MIKLVKKKPKTCRTKTCRSRLAPDSASGLCINCETAAYRARQKSRSADVTGTNEFILYANAVCERVKLYTLGATVRQLKEHFPGSDYWLTLVLNGDTRLYSTSRSVGVTLYHFGRSAGRDARTDAGECSFPPRRITPFYQSYE